MWRKLVDLIVTEVESLELLQVRQTLRQILDQVLSQLKRRQVLQKAEVLRQDGQGHVVQAEDHQVLQQDEAGGQLGDWVGAEVGHLQGGQALDVLRDVRDVVPRDVQLDQVGEVLYSRS